MVTSCTCFCILTQSNMAAVSFFHCFTEQAWRSWRHTHSFFFSYKWDTIEWPCLCFTKQVWSCAIISMLKGPIWPPLLSLTKRICPPWRHQIQHCDRFFVLSKSIWRPWRHAKNYYLSMNSTWPPFHCSSKPGWRPCGHAHYFPYKKFQYGGRDVMHQAIQY